MQVQGLPTEFRPWGDHNDESGVAGRKPAETTMEADVAGFDHEHKRGGSEQPKRRGDGMYVDDLGYRRLLLEVVVQIEAEADATKIQKMASQTSAARRSSRAGHDAVVWTYTRFVPLVSQRNVQRWD